MTLNGQLDGECERQSSFCVLTLAAFGCSLTRARSPASGSGTSGRCRREPTTLTDDDEEEEDSAGELR